ncbi:hypothetical protein COMA1_10554 [Candidatus Nitrospira nitrosa]|uniref:Uncharacterized protein n=1 Tax=Candidatus Nitrospira nitrosa TaxID=1742972 RepID=A0A0S4L905_9BACT|nr:hypothetical protein COMA1_10554 [Candidatus Nitrospira nitrosa]
MSASLSWTAGRCAPPSGNVRLTVVAGVYVPIRTNAEPTPTADRAITAATRFLVNAPAKTS